MKCIFRLTLLIVIATMGHDLHAYDYPLTFDSIKNVQSCKEQIVDSLLEIDAYLLFQPLQTWSGFHLSYQTPDVLYDTPCDSLLYVGDALRLFPDTNMIALQEWRDMADTLRCKKVRIAGYLRKALRNCINDECVSEYYYYLEVREINNTIVTITRESGKPFRRMHEGQSSVYVKVTVGFDECAAASRNRPGAGLRQAQLSSGACGQ